MEFKPSIFAGYPMDSIFQEFNSEKIARNIMIILKRTGDVFRELTWEEYKEERLKDGAFTDAEKFYFDKLKYLATADQETLLNFSPSWKEDFENQKQK